MISRARACMRVRARERRFGLRLERIEEALSKIQFPLNFSDQVYNLRSHIDIVRRKIESRLHSYGRVAAE